MRENSYWLPHTDRVLLVFCALSSFLMRLLAGWAGQLCAGDRAFCLVYEVNGQVGVRMGRRRKYLINAYTKSLIVLHIPLFFSISFSISFSELGQSIPFLWVMLILILSVACIYKESVVGVCVLLCSSPVCHTARALFECVTLRFTRPCLFFLFMSIWYLCLFQLRFGLKTIV